MSNSTGRLALQIGGTAVGAYFGGPVGAAIGGSIGGYAGTQLFPPEIPDGPRLEDQKIQSSAYGAPIPEYWGSWRAAGNIIWSAGIREHKNQESVGKGGGPERTTYSYTCSFAVAFCVGPADGIARLWADSVLLMSTDVKNDPAKVLESADPGGEAQNWRVYLGTETQQPDGLIESYEGEGQVPAFRGLVYVVFEDMELDRFGRRIPQITAEIAKGVSPTREQSGGFGDPREILSQSLTVERVKDGVVFLGGQAKAWSDDWDTRVTLSRTMGGEVHGIDLATYNYISSERWVHTVPPACTRNDIWLETTRDFECPVGYTRDSEAASRPDVPATIKTFPGGEEYHPGVVYWTWDKPAKSEDPVLGGSRTGALFGPHYTSVYDANSGLVGPHAVQNLLTAIATPEGLVMALQTQTGAGAEPVFLYWDTWVERYPEALSALATTFVTIDWLSYDAVNELVAVGFREDSSQVSSYRYMKLFERGIVERYHFDLTNVPNLVDGVNDVSLWGDQMLVRLSAGGNDYGIREFRLDFDNETVEFVANWFNGQSNGVSRDFFHLRRDLILSVEYGLVGDAVGQPDYPVADVIADLCEQAGLDAGDYDVAQVTDTVNGYSRTRPAEVKANLAPLATAFHLDAVESEGVLRWLPRGGDPVAVIPDQDLAAHDPGQEPPDKVVGSRVQEMELPRRVAVQYSDPDMDYEQGVQYASRLNMEVRHEEVLRLPVAVNRDKAARIAEEKLLSAWMERVSRRWSTTLKWAHLDPGDVVTLDTQEGQFVVRIGQVDIDPSRLIGFEGVRVDASTYQSAATGGQAPSPAPAGTSGGGPARFEVMDLPPLLPEHNGAGYYLAMGGYKAGWPGGVLLRAPVIESETATGGGTTFEAGEFTSVTAVTTPATLGTVDESLTHAEPWLWDEGTHLVVRLVTGTLSNATKAQVYEGANAALVGDEVIGFRNAEPLGNSRYRLTGLLRGRRGTDWAVGTHDANERFVLLDSAILRQSVTNDRLGTEQFFTAITMGSALDSGVAVRRRVGKGSLKPFAPAHLRGSRSVVDGSISVSWVRRTRVEGGLLDYVDVPLGEAEEKYQVEVLDPSSYDASGMILVATYTTTQPTWTYSAAAQQSDNDGALLDPAVIRIRQLSARVGPGYPREITV
jgi:hypothetical protein